MSKSLITTPIIGQLTAEWNTSGDDGDAFFFHLLEHRIETVVGRGAEDEHVDALGHHGFDLCVLFGHVAEFAGDADLYDLAANTFCLVDHSVGHALPEIVLEVDESDAIADDRRFVLDRLRHPEVPVLLLFSVNFPAHSGDDPHG